MRFRVSVSCAATIGLLLGSPSSLTADDQRPLPFRQLRAFDAEGAAAISACYIHSSTCRRLIEEIESSSTTVYVRRGECQIGKGGSCLQFGAARAGARYLHLVLDRDRFGDCLVSSAAHELQHVVEVVRAPQVVDLASFRSLFSRVGFFIRGSGMREEWETEEAQRITLVVSKEVRRSQRATRLALQ